MERAFDGGGRHELFGGGAPDCRTVLCAHVVALAHSLSRVVVFQEDSEDRLGRDLIGVVGYSNGFGVSGASRAHLVVNGVRGETAHLPDGGLQHSVGVPKQLFGSPKTAHG